MKKINSQNFISINHFDYSVTYLSSGEAVINIGFFNDNIMIHKSEIFLTKEDTDKWQQDDSIIIEKIQTAFPNLDLTIIN